MTSLLKRLLTRKDVILALVLICLAGLPRLTQLDLAEFKLDEANHYRMAYYLTRGSWRWLGSMASVGIPKPPLLVYVLALPLALTSDPRVAVGMLGVLASLAAGGFYLVLRRFLGRKAAFGAALLFAVNPQAILYARKFFTADLLPPLCTLFLAAGITFLEAPPRRLARTAAAATFSFALLALTTFSPLMLIPTLLWLFMERRRDLRLSHWLWAAAALTLPLVPYAVALAPHASAALNAAGETASSAEPFSLLGWMWELLSGSPWPESLLSWPGVAAILLVLLSLIGLWLLLGRARERRAGRWARFALGWLFLSPLFALALPIEVHSQYLVVLYPLLFLLPAAGIEALNRRSKNMGRVALLAVALVASWQAGTWVNAIQAVAAGVPGYGTPLGYWWRAAEQARALAQDEHAAEVLVVVPGDRAWDGKANILDALLGDTPHRIVDGRTTFLFPPHPAVLLIASEVDESVERVLPCTQDLNADLPASPLGGTYGYRLWPPALGDASICTEVFTPAEGEWASGVRLLGYQVAGTAGPGETIQVALHWETTGGPLDQDVHWFHHLLDPQGQRWAQFDGVGWPASRWQPGDRVVVQFELAIAQEAAPPPYTLRVGQYTYPDMIGVSTLDVAGNPVADAVTLPVPTE
jgi:4-amino-4-deoxy-L-arabinose transferase-like glycosyltransferase